MAPKKYTWKDNSIGRSLVEPVMQAGGRLNPPLNAVRSVITTINKAPGMDLPLPPANPVQMAKGGILKKGKPPKGFKPPKRRGR